MFCHGGVRADSHSIDIHGTQTAGKVAASFSLRSGWNWILWVAFALCFLHLIEQSQMLWSIYQSTAYFLEFDIPLPSVLSIMSCYVM